MFTFLVRVANAHKLLAQAHYVTVFVQLCVLIVVFIATAVFPRSPTGPAI